MKLICAYDKEKKAIANHRCDICGKLLCSFCGYSKDGIDYCNECWIKKDDLEGKEIERSELKQLLKEIADEL